MLELHLLLGAPLAAKTQTNRWCGGARQQQAVGAGSCLHAAQMEGQVQKMGWKRASRLRGCPQAGYPTSHTGAGSGCCGLQAPLAASRHSRARRLKRGTTQEAQHVTPVASRQRVPPVAARSAGGTTAALLTGTARSPAAAWPAPCATRGSPRLSGMPPGRTLMADRSDSCNKPSSNMPVPSHKKLPPVGSPSCLLVAVSGSRGTAQAGISRLAWDRAPDAALQPAPSASPQPRAGLTTTLSDGVSQEPVAPDSMAQAGCSSGKENPRSEAGNPCWQQPPSVAQDSRRCQPLPSGSGAASAALQPTPAAQRTAREAAASTKTQGKLADKLKSPCQREGAARAPKAEEAAAQALASPGGTTRCAQAVRPGAGAPRARLALTHLSHLELAGKRSARASTTGDRIAQVLAVSCGRGRDQKCGSVPANGVGHGRGRPGAPRRSTYRCPWAQEVFTAALRQHGRKWPALVVDLGAKSEAMVRYHFGRARQWLTGLDEAADEGDAARYAVVATARGGAAPAAAACGRQAAAPDATTVPSPAAAGPKEAIPAAMDGAAPGVALGHTAFLLPLASARSPRNSSAAAPLPLQLQLLGPDVHETHQRPKLIVRLPRSRAARARQEGQQSGGVGSSRARPGRRSGDAGALAAAAHPGPSSLSSGGWLALLAAVAEAEAAAASDVCSKGEARGSAWPRAPRPSSQQPGTQVPPQDIHPASNMLLPRLPSDATGGHLSSSPAVTHNTAHSATDIAQENVPTAAGGASAPKALAFCPVCGCALGASTGGAAGPIQAPSCR
jgi:hypothetical protein